MPNRIKCGGECLNKLPPHQPHPSSIPSLHQLHPTPSTSFHFINFITLLSNEFISPFFDAASSTRPSFLLNRVANAQNLPNSRTTLDFRHSNLAVHLSLRRAIRSYLTGRQPSDKPVTMPKLKRRTTNKRYPRPFLPLFLRLDRRTWKRLLLHIAGLARLALALCDITNHKVVV
jgi:hypothetical protein